MYSAPICLFSYDFQNMELIFISEYLKGLSTPSFLVIFFAFAMDYVPPNKTKYSDSHFTSF